MPSMYNIDNEDASKLTLWLFNIDGHAIINIVW